MPGLVPLPGNGRERPSTLDSLGHWAIPRQNAMKIIRFYDKRFELHYGQQHDDGRVTLLKGDIFAGATDTGQPAEIGKLLAPVDPAAILCIGLNYRKHAEEGGK